jgi:hypothetical protein
VYDLAMGWGSKKKGATCDIYGEWKRKGKYILKHHRE